MGIAAYRSALTLDWLAAEDLRQRELAAAFETEASPARVVSSDCVAYPKPSAGKIGRLMLELLKNLEGDDGVLVPELMQVLVKTKILVESSMFDSEPDFESLVKTPDVMMGEPHITFPRILAIIWMIVTDPVATNKYGWCPIKKVNKYLSSERPYEVAKQMRAMDIVVARARFIMEEFIQSVMPTNMYQKTTIREKKIRQPNTTWKHGKKRAPDLVTFPTFSTSNKQSSLEAEMLQSGNIIDKANDITSRSNSLKLVSPLCPTVHLHIEIPDLSEDRWTYRQRLYDEEMPCLHIQPSNKDIIKRFYAILPYFDRDHSNTAFLRKYRATVHGLTDTEDLLDREAAYHAAVLTPLVFLHQYRDTWCLLERFHRALRLYQISHPTEKRSALKLLQNFRAVNNKVRAFVMDLPSSAPLPRTTMYPDDDEEIHDKKDIKFLKELVKNLG
ncbi:unnamed protein product [Leptosia nina]|uniref:Uncharacterized protein n=1 Tax=Leptosia nina TaxID=320188 RepID=A0AAV1J104_9NEOP